MMKRAIYPNFTALSILLLCFGHASTLHGAPEALAKDSEVNRSHQTDELMFEAMKA